MAKIDSGLGWKVDEDFYIYEADTLIDEDDYGRKKYDGSAIIAIVFEGENTQGRPVMISTVENNCLNTQAMTAYSSDIGGVTWYGTRQNTLLRENEIIVGAKVTVAEGINPYYFPDDAETRAAIISAIITQAGVEYTPKVPTTDYVKDYVEGVVKGNNALILDAVDDILTDDTVYSEAAMITIPDCKVPSNTAVSVTFEPVQKGTGDPSPENIRPITGYSNITITRTGKNLIGSFRVRNAVGNNGAIVSNSYSNITNRIVLSDPTTSYVLSDDITEQITGRYAHGFNENNTYLGYFSITNGAAFIPNNSLAGIKSVILQWNYYNMVTDAPINAQFEKGTTATQFEQSATDYTLDLNGTRYGGRVDISDTGEAVLTVDRGYTTITWGDYGETTTLTNCTRRKLYAISDAKGCYVGTKDISDVMPMIDSYTVDTPHFYIAPSSKCPIAFMPNGTSDDTEIQFCYELSTPLQIRLANTPIQLLAGINNLYSDAGNISATVNGIASAIGALTEQVNDITLYPDPPTTDGTYTLQVSVSSGVPTYSWAAVNRSAPAVVNEPDEKKGSEEIAEEKEIDVSEPAEKDEPDEMTENKIDENLEIKNDEKAEETKAETDLENW